MPNESGLDALPIQPTNYVENTSLSQTPEMRFFTGIQESVLSEDQFNIMAETHGFTDKFRGTWKSEKENMYMYVKNKMIFETTEQAMISIQMARYLTEKGILYPYTQWGIYQTKDGKYQLFAITRQLEAWTSEGNEMPDRQRVLTNIGEANNYASLFAKNSHVLEWVKRVNPNFDPNKKPDNDNDLAVLLNPFEASHSDNWAWDENGRLYPIDIEVLDLAGDKQQQIIKNWDEQQKTKRFENIRDLFKLYPTDAEDLKKQLAATNGLLRIFIHPFYRINHGEVATTEKISKGIERILTSSSPATPPILIFEEENMVDKTAERLRPILEKSGRHVIFLETNKKTPNPRKYDFMTDSTEDARWKAVVEVFKELGVKTIFIGGEKLEMIEGDISSYMNPDLNHFRQLRRSKGANRVDYNFLGCVGHAINIFSKNGINVEISNFAAPNSRADIVEYEQRE